MQPYIEVTFRMALEEDEKLIEQIEAYNAFVDLTSKAEGPTSWLKRLA